MEIEHKTLRDVMIREVITVPMNLPVEKVAGIMAGKKLSSVVVVGPDGGVVGMITNMDILKVFEKDPKGLTAESIMTPWVITAKPTTTIEEAARIMHEKHIHKLLIVSESGVGASYRPIGILSASDIIREVTAS